MRRVGGAQPVPCGCLFRPQLAHYFYGFLLAKLSYLGICEAGAGAQLINEISGDCFGGRLTGAGPGRWCARLDAIPEVRFADFELIGEDVPPDRGSVGVGSVVGGVRYSGPKGASIGKAQFQG